MMKTAVLRLLAAISFATTLSQAAPVGIDHRPNLPYAGSKDPRQTLDLFLPRNPSPTPVPLVVVIHGGGWVEGRKEDTHQVARHIAGTGRFAAASINYRLLGQAIWPAQLDDCKAAVRYLRANAKSFGLTPEHIAALGFSAGGHLSVMLGTTGDEKDLEGTVGHHLKESSKISCVVNFFGPSNLESIGGHQGKQLTQTLQREAADNPLLQALLDNVQSTARKASPVTWASTGDAPTLTAHGTLDTVVPFSQAEEIHAALQKAKVETYLIPVKDAGHGFHNDALNLRIFRFLENHLCGTRHSISSAPVTSR